MGRRRGWLGTVGLVVVGLLVWLALVLVMLQVIPLPG